MPLIPPEEIKVFEIIEALEEEGNITQRTEIWINGANEIFESKQELSETLRNLRDKGLIECQSKQWHTIV